MIENNACTINIINDASMCITDNSRVTFFSVVSLLQSSLKSYVCITVHCAMTKLMNLYFSSVIVVFFRNNSQDSSFRHIMQVLYNVNHDAGDIYGEMGSNVLFDIKMIVTDKHNRLKMDPLQLKI